MNDRPSTRRQQIEESLGLSHQRPDPRRIFLFPQVITFLLSAMVVVFVLQWVLPPSLSNRISFLFGFIPFRFSYGLEEGISSFVLMIPLFGHMFLHAGVMHLALNMIGLVIFGTGVARRLATEESDRGARYFNISLFLSFFLFCGIVGAFGFYLMHPTLPIPLVGASGAISGLMGAAFRFALRGYLPHGVTQGALSPLWSRPVLAASLVFIGFNLLTGLGMGAGEEGVNIAWEAHIFGYLCGLLTFPLFDQLARKSKTSDFFG
ncbi:MAG: rhomboid family intramembrane serine protease [Pseudomonadota bacterium]